MDRKETIWIKKEEANVYTEPGFVDQFCASSVKVKEELQEEVNAEVGAYALLPIPESDPLRIKNEEFLEDPLRIERPSVHVKDDDVGSEGVTLDVDECNVDAYAVLPIYESKPLIIKNEEGVVCENVCLHEWDPLNIEDEKEVGPKRCASLNTWLLKHIGETGNMLLEETVKGIIGDKLEVLAEKSPHFSGSCTPTEVFSSQEDNTLYTKNNDSIPKTEFQDFICNSCKDNFSSKYKLIMHVFTHIDGVEPPEHICMCCGEVFLTSSILSKHCMMEPEISQEESEHSRMSHECCCLQSYDLLCVGKRSHKCEVFAKSFNISGNLKKKTLIHTGIRPHKCDICRKTFPGSRNVKQHKLIHIGYRTHRCNVCGKSFNQSGNLRKHRSIVAGKRHKCDVCGKAFTVSGDLKRHTLIHTGERPHKCNICGKSFKQSGHLKKHNFIHTGKRPHKCDVCGKAFTGTGDLNRHKLCHTGDRPHLCNVCGKSFRTSCSLLTHKLIHTGERPHQCNVCGKSFNHSGNLRKHRLIHAGKRHKCDVCGKAFTESGHLKRHTLIHTGERAHKCNLCGKSFSQSGHLKKHKLIHTGERHHKCDVCGRAFTATCDLKRHKLSHTGERPHICNVCGKSFTRSGHLRSHSLIHLGE